MFPKNTVSMKNSGVGTLDQDYKDKYIDSYRCRYKYR